MLRNKDPREAEEHKSPAVTLPPDMSSETPKKFVRQGLWFEEFEEGLVIESAGRTITESDLVQFAGLSGDFAALHTNEEACKKTPFRTRIAHGMLVQSIATGLGIQTGAFEGTLSALTKMVIEWQAPVLPGDTIRLTLTVTSVDEAPSRRAGRVNFAAQVHNQKDKLVVDGQWQTRMLRNIQPQASPATES